MKKQLTYPIIWIVSVSIFMFSSCSLSKDIQITGTPSGAEVYIDNVKEGITPYSSRRTFYDKISAQRVLVKAPDYEDTLFSITYNPKKMGYYSYILRKKDVVSVNLIDFQPVSQGGAAKLMKITRRTLAYLTTIENSSSVKSAQKVTSNEDTTFNISGPVVSPDGKSILYTIYETINENGKIQEKCNVYSQKLSSNARTSITKGNYIDLFPCFSRDGEYIYYSTDRIKDNNTICKVKSTGASGITSITSTNAEDFQPSFGLNTSIETNDWIAYTSNLPFADQPQIWTISTNGTLPTQLREGESPDVSPDGKKIVFIRVDKSHSYIRGTSNEYPKQIWIMDVDGSNETQITPNIDFTVSDTRWSPDGSWIVFTSDQGKDNSGRNNFDIWCIKPDGTSPTQLTINGSVDDHPFWSTDGRIFFRSNRGGNWNIWSVMPVLPK
jgi:Tol biopolymer transport system component